jgi:hypothetical protein
MKYQFSIVLLAMGLATSGAASAGTIEQNSGVFDSALAAFDPIGQSFLAEDTQLGLIAFAFSDINPSLSNDPVTVTLYQGAGFGGSIIDTATQTLPAVLPGTQSSPVLIDFDFTGTSLVVGQIYTAAVTTGSSFKVAVVYSGTDVYAGGQLFHSGGSALNGCSAGACPFDMNFRITPVPEAETYAMMLAGLGLVGWTARRRAQV